jgi:hypothetical protein
MANKTRLFNIRITEDKHARFKKFAEKKKMTMGAILHHYIDAILNEEMEVLGENSGRKQAKYDDPLDAIRGQYTPGEDF